MAPLPLPAPLHDLNTSRVPRTFHVTRVRWSTVVTHVTSLPAYAPSAQISCSPGKRATKALSTG
jgi:hypothetical protein